MNTQSFPYWARGAIAGLLFPAFLFALLPIIPTEAYQQTFSILAYPLFLLMFLFASGGPIRGDTVLLSVLMMIPYVVIGGVIGWCIGKLPQQRRQLAVTATVIAFLLLIGGMTYVNEKEMKRNHFVGFTVEDCETQEGTEEGKVLCISRVYENFPPNVETCKKISSLEVPYSRCITYVAEDQDDPKFCDTFTDKMGKDYCLLSIPNKDISVCDTMKEQWQRESCIITVAMATQDHSYCYLLPKMGETYGKNQNDCAVGIMQSKFEKCGEDHECMSDVCSDVEDPGFKGACEWAQKESIRDHQLLRH